MRNFSKDDILEALGLQQRGDNFLAPLLIGVGCGALVGATLTLLLTPRSGSELRSDLMERGRRMMQRGREELEDLAQTMENSRGTTNEPQRH